MSGHARNISGQIRNMSGQIRNMSGQVRNMSGQVQGWIKCVITWSIFDRKKIKLVKEFRKEMSRAK